MFEAIRKKRSKLFDFDISDEESCRKAIRNGGIAALVLAALTAVIAIVAMNTTTDDPDLAYLLDPWIIVDAILLAVLALFVFRRSRVAATVLLVYYTLSKIMLWIEIGAPKGLLVSALFFMTFLTSARATFAWHSTYRHYFIDPAQQGSPAKPAFGVVVGLYTFFFFLLAVVSALLLRDDWTIWRAEGGLLSFVDLAIAVVSVIGGAALIVLILRRHRLAQDAVRLYFFGRGAIAAVTVVGIALLTDFPADSSQSGAVWFNIAMLLFCAAGFMYWSRSKRVRSLFAPAPVAPRWSPNLSRVAAASVPTPLPALADEVSPGATMRHIDLSLHGAVPSALRLAR